MLSWQKRHFDHETLKRIARIKKAIRCMINLYNEFDIDANIILESISENLPGKMKAS
jgi:hypothetical protein